MAKRYNVVMGGPKNKEGKSFNTNVGVAFENTSAAGTKYITVKVPFLPSDLVLFEATEDGAPKGKGTKKRAVAEDDGDF